MRGARLWGLVAVTMLAFAANSLLTRAAVGAGHIDALSFASVRVIAGAVMLAVLVLPGGGRPVFPPRRRFWAAGWLSLYLLAFSLAYVQLDAGLGALVLFGTVQLVMFGGALWGREQVPRPRWFGMGLAFAGLVVLSWPSGVPSGALSGAISGAPGSVWATGLMLLAGLGWGGYSLLGRSSTAPLPETAAAFLIAVPLVCIPVLILGRALAGPVFVAPWGISLAVISGAVTSGLGYALWYRVLPSLGASTAALVQLSAPLLAVIGGVLILGEPLGWRLVLAAGLILGGIAMGVVQRKSGSSGS